MRTAAEAVNCKSTGIEGTVPLKLYIYFHERRNEMLKKRMSIVEKLLCPKEANSVNAHIGIVTKVIKVVAHDSSVQNIKMSSTLTENYTYF